MIQTRGTSWVLISVPVFVFMFLQGREYLEYESLHSVRDRGSGEYLPALTVRIPLRETSPVSKSMSRNLSLST